MIYTLFVGLGVVAALVLGRVGGSAPVPGSVRVAALGGAVLGAHLFELPADLWGWTAEVSGLGPPILGRTVLGGLLGGWIAVELEKKRIGLTRPTGDGFALPLAVGLTFGRLGCVLTGCCPGRVVESGSVWARLPIMAEGPPRFPATLVEAYFHAICALVLLVMRARAIWPGRHLALYLTAYSMVRFALEWERENPPIAGPFTYYQLLATALFALSAITLWRRASPSAAASPASA